MRVKAIVTFGGQYAMRQGETAELPDNPVTRALVQNGFIAEAPEPEPDAPEDEPETAAKEDAQEAARDEQDLKRLRKEDLLKICKERGIKVSGKATNNELIEAIKSRG